MAQRWPQASPSLRQQATQALDPILKQIGQTNNPFAVRTFARAIRSLAPRLTDAQAAQVLEPILKQIGQTTNADVLLALVQALPERLTDAQAHAVLDPILKQVGETTDPFALLAFAEAIQQCLYKSAKFK